MSQYDWGTMDPNTKSGTQLATDLNSWRDAMHTMHSGTSRPTYAKAGTLWLDTTATPWLLKQYDGVDDIVIGEVNSSTNQFVPYVNGSKARDWALKEAAVLSKTGAYSVVAADDGKKIRADTTTAAWTLSLLAVASAGDGFRIEVENIGTADNDLTIDPSGAETINGSATLALKSGQSAVVWCSGSSWFAYVSASDDAEQSWAKQQYHPEQTLTDGITISWDVRNNPVAKVTLAGNRTLANPTNMRAGAFYALRVIQDATGGRTLAYGTAYKWLGGAAPTLSTGANAVDLLIFYSDGTSMFGVAHQDFS